MASESLSIRYPRYVVRRAILRFLGYGLLRLLTRVRITGYENIPRKGPLILVGNHVAMLEAVMMVLCTPFQTEIIGNGDIPFDPKYSWAVQLWGIIPIQRGTMDREALNVALDVLKQGGIVGIFPEGGIWESTAKKSKTGVSWLSYQAGAPILPIGFGGIDGALGAAFKLKRPEVSMNIGQVIPAINPEAGDKPRKLALEDAASYIMAQVDALIPEADKKRWRRIVDERFELQLKVERPDGQVVELPPELQISRPEMLAKFFHRPLLLDVFSRNLKLPVQALQALDTEHDPVKLADASDAALGYLKDNPYFLTYRFGYDEGGAMEMGLRQLRDIGRWAGKQGMRLVVKPIRRFRQRGKDEEFVEEKPGSVPLL